MISFQGALDEILKRAAATEPVLEVLENLLGRVLAEDVRAGFDLPRFDNSAMDGYAVSASDIFAAPVTLVLQDTIQAGDVGDLELKPGHAIRIMTGAVVPKGADAVVMREDCELDGDAVLIRASADAKENIREAGEEFKRGQVILKRGTPVTPPVIGLLATLGLDRALVYRAPRVAVMVTGNELVKPGKALRDGQIYDSNSYALAAALKALYIESATFYVPDDKTQTREMFERVLASHDVVITVGGVSVGDFDFIKEVVETSGIETCFWRIAMKPGKPVYFGKSKDGKLVFGLPGNPVSALVTFHQLVQPALKKMLGFSENNLECFKARLLSPLNKKQGRLEFVRGQLLLQPDGYGVAVTTGQDSHMLGGLAEADGLIVFPDEAESFASGDEVMVERLSWSR